MKKCPTPSKRSYRTKQNANKQIREMWRTGRGTTLVKRSYKCPCGDWHTTSKPFRKSKNSSKPTVDPVQDAYKDFLHYYRQYYVRAGFHATLAAGEDGDPKTTLISAVLNSQEAKVTLSDAMLTKILAIFDASTMEQDILLDWLRVHRPELTPDSGSKSPEIVVKIEASDPASVEPSGF